MIFIGFGTNEKWTSKLIRWATESDWSHCWIEFKSLGDGWGVHSGPDGVVLVPIERIEETYPERTLYELNIDVEKVHLGFRWARDRVGADYDYGVIQNLILLLLWKATKWRFLWDLVARNASKFSCSEFVSGFLVAAKVPGVGGLDPETVYPGLLEEFCDNSTNFYWSGHE